MSGPTRFSRYTPVSLEAVRRPRGCGQTPTPHHPLTPSGLTIPRYRLSPRQRNVTGAGACDGRTRRRRQGGGLYRICRLLKGRMSKGRTVYKITNLPSLNNSILCIITTTTVSSITLQHQPLPLHLHRPHYLPTSLRVYHPDLQPQTNLRNGCHEEHHHLRHRPLPRRVWP